ncbi:MAG TPA: META domain-containing protein [Thermomicrobiales bacterium]|nr:META domain-containing protein [Thermomicrobiales bacterium]
MKSGIWLVGILAASMLLAGCGGEASADSLTGTKWELDELNGRDALDDVLVTMQLDDDDDLSGTSGCNRYIGSWETDDGDKITLEPSGLTMMACDQPVMDQEQAFLEALASAVRFDLGVDELELYNAEGREVAEFDRLKPINLMRTPWVVVAINDGENRAVPVLEGTTLMALFESEDDRLSGQGGCNTFTTTYSRDGEEMTIETPIAATLMACDQPVMDQETMFFEALGRTATFELGDETLLLRSEDGSMQVWFKDAD